MEIIVSIKKNKGTSYEVLTKSGKTYQVSEDILVKYRLLKGEEIGGDVLRKIEKEAMLDQAYQQVLNYLSYQLRSEKELVDYLKKKEVAPEGIHHIIGRLKDLELVNDRVFAESYVRTIIKTSDKGPFVIKQNLKKKGISDENIAIALDQLTDDSEEKIAMATAQKALRKYQKKSFKETKNKVRQHLQTKGFSGDVINIVMEELALEKDQETETELLAQLGTKLWERHKKLEPFKRKQKVITSLMGKGFNYDDINVFISEKEAELTDEE